MDPIRLHPQAQAQAQAPAAGAKSDEAAAARKAAQGLEAFLVRRMLAEMRGSLGGSGEGGLLDGGFAGSTFREMLDESLADRIAGAGGIGLAPIFERELLGRKGLAPAAGNAPPPGKPAATRPAAAALSLPASRVERAYRVAGNPPAIIPPPPDDPGVVLPAPPPSTERDR